MPAIATALAGLFTGDFLRSSRTQGEKLLGLILSGAAATIVGLVFHPWFPINKNLWTSTYVLFTAGMALLLLAVIYFMVDVKRIDGWARPFLIFGTNAIFAFFSSTLMAKITYVIPNLQQRLYRPLFGNWLPDYAASLAWALMYVVLWWGLTALLYRRRVFLKV